MKKRKFNLFYLLFLFISSIILQAQVPQLINYQGNITENGVAFNNTASITFTLFDELTDGTNLWSETQSVIITNGIFNVLLGSVTTFPTDLFTGAGNRFLEVSVNGTLLTPRYQFTSVAYSLSAQMAEEVKPGEVVTSLNNLEDDVILAAGPNISITEAGDTITIAVTGGTDGGDITAVAAGDGLTGGGDVGDVSLDVGAGSGINVTPDAIELNTVFTDGRYVNSDEANSVTGSMIVDGQVGNADIAPNAEIEQSKISNASPTINADMLDGFDESEFARAPILTRVHYNGSTSDNTISTTYELLRTIGTFNKVSASSDIELTWIDHLRVTGSFVEFQIRIDNLKDNGSASTGYEGTSGGSAVVYSENSPVSVFTVFQNLSIGDHSISIWIRGSATSCTMNNGSFGHDVFVREISQVTSIPGSPSNKSIQNNNYVGGVEK